MSPSYAPPFHDLSEIGPGVKRATLKAGFCSLGGDFEGEHALNVIAKQATTSVDKHLINGVCRRLGC
jgi:hypothetical protein